jgi:hypothetical protein
MLTPSPWRWRQHGPLKRWYPTTTLLLLCGSTVLEEPWPPHILNSFMWGFVARNVLRGGVIAPRPTSNLEDQWITLCHLPIDLSGLGDPVRGLCSRLHSSRGRARKPPHTQRVLRQGGSPWGGGVNTTTLHDVKTKKNSSDSNLYCLLRP